MKRILLAFIVLGGAITSWAQTDTTGNRSPEKVDTIKVGGTIIIRKSGDYNKDSGREMKDTVITAHHRRHFSNPTINWWIVDIGFTNYNDRTNYASADAQQFAPGNNKDRLSLRNGKSVNVNLWIFMQRFNIVKNYINFKYGLGLELNNYRYDDNNVLFQKNPTQITYQPSAAVEKNKLAADYVTLPAMINFNFAPHRKKSFGFSAGISAGYLYSAREKLKFNTDKKEKVHSDFDLNKWKLSYIGELNLGIVRLYGSYALKSMWSKGLDQTPYSFGMRLSNW